MKKFSTISLLSRFSEVIPTTELNERGEEAMVTPSADQGLETALLIVDIDAYLAGDESQCPTLGRGLESKSAVLFKDSRVPDHDEYLGMMMRYFAQSPEVLMRDARPAQHFEVGVTPPYSEHARNHRPMLSTWPSHLWPHLGGPDFKGDAKWRFMHQICDDGVVPNFEPVIPTAFADIWERLTNEWGQALKQSIWTMAEMVAKYYKSLGLNVPINAFTRMLDGATHILAPNGIDLSGPEIRKGLILNEFHYDLNFGTAHSAASAPGLRTWIGTSDVMPVRVPQNLLLFQAGKQLEWLTGGRIRAGFHEVVVLQETLEAIGRLQSRGLPPVRATTTLFGESHWRRLLRVLEAFLPSDPFLRAQVQAMYPAVPVSYQVLEELYFIGLAKQAPILNEEMSNLLPGESELAYAA